jgi:hypothetical protein
MACTASRRWVPTDSTLSRCGTHAMARGATLRCRRGRPLQLQRCVGARRRHAARVIATARTRDAWPVALVQVNVVAFVCGSSNRPCQVLTGGEDHVTFWHVQGGSLIPYRGSFGAKIEVCRCLVGVVLALGELRRVSLLCAAPHNALRRSSQRSSVHRWHDGAPRRVD